MKQLHLLRITLGIASMCVLLWTNLANCQQVPTMWSMEKLRRATLPGRHLIALLPFLVHHNRTGRSTVVTTVADWLPV